MARPSPALAVCFGLGLLPYLCLVVSDPFFCGPPEECLGVICEVFLDGISHRPFIEMEKKDNEGQTLYSMDEADEDAFLTPWSLVHYLSGAAMKGLGLSFPVALVHGAYEVKDQSVHDRERCTTPN